jgi:hypothetical protein
LVEKGIGHSKATVITKSTEAINLLFATSESFEDCADSLIELATHKNVKMV